MFRSHPATLLPLPLFPKVFHRYALHAKWKCLRSTNHDRLVRPLWFNWHNLTISHGEIPESVGRMTGPVMQRLITEFLLLVVPFGLILAKGFQSIGAACFVEPAAMQYLPHCGNSVLNRVLLDDLDVGLSELLGHYFDSLLGF